MAEQPFWDHLTELAHRTKVVLYSIAICSSVASLIPSNPLDFFSFNSSYNPMISVIIKKIEADLLPKEGELIAPNVMDIVLMYFVVALSIGIILSSPVIIYETYAFINPALYPHERKAIFPYLIVSGILFLLGIAYNYFLILPLTFKIILQLIEAAEVSPFLSVSSFFSFVFLASIGSGVFFIFPVIIVLLVKMGIMGTETLKKNRAAIYVAVLVFAAIITPDPTPLTMFILFIPFVILYEGSLFFAKRIERKAELEELKNALKLIESLKRKTS